jgi:hypothetical protein
MLSGDAADDEIEFLKSLRFKDRRPNPLFYYRVLQITRDPLHFRISTEPGAGQQPETSGSVRQPSPPTFGKIG